MRISAAAQTAVERFVRAVAVVDPLSQYETLELTDESFDGAFVLPRERPDTIGYIERVLTSGFPQGVKRNSDRTRVAWLNSYVDHLVGRDIELIAEVRDPMRLRRYLAALAANTAGTPSMSTR